MATKLTKQERTVAAFDSTHEALSAEAVCKAAGIAGRLIPTPPEIRADCGLAWMCEPQDEASLRILFDQQHIEGQIYRLRLWTC